MQLNIQCDNADCREYISVERHLIDKPIKCAACGHVTSLPDPVKEQLIRPLTKAEEQGPEESVTFASVDGKVLLFALKEGSSPTDEDVQHMIANSMLSQLPQPQSNLKIMRFTFDEMYESYKKSQLLVIDRKQAIGNATLIAGCFYLKEHGSLSDSQAVDLFGFYSNPEGSMLLIGFRRLETPSKPKVKKPWWKLW